MSDKFTSREEIIEGYLSYPFVFQSHVNKKTKKETYMCDVVGLDVLTAARLKNLQAECITAHWGPPTSWPRFEHKAVRPSEDKEFDKATGQKKIGYNRGEFFISPTSLYQPLIVDLARQPIIDAKVLYAGCRVAVKVNAYVWKDENGNKKGVKFGLLGIMKIGEGTPFGAGKPDANKMFGDYAPPPPPAGAPAAGFSQAAAPVRNPMDEL